MAENTRKTSNIIHTVDDLKTDVINNSEDIQSNTDAINNLVIPNAANDGRINLSQGKGIHVTGTDATADQAKDTSWTVAVDNTVALKSDIPDIPAPVVPGDGTMKLSGGTGIDIAGANGTANQTGDSNQTISIDSTVALKAEIPPAVVPGDGDITLISSDGSVAVQGKNASANQAGDTEWDLSVDVDNIDNIVKDIVSANPSTLTVSEADGIYTLTAVGGGGGTGGGIIVMEGDGIKIDSEIVEIDGDDYTQYTIKTDKDWLEANLDFATNQDIIDAIGNIDIPEAPTKTSDLTNDGEDGTNEFITAADIPDPPTVPTKTSDLVNDGEGTDPFITASDIPDGDFLPMAGGMMDAGADVIIPSGASVTANLIVGGTVGDTVVDNFNIAARGTTKSPTAQVVTWPKPGGSAYFKLCTSEDITSYWNIAATPAKEDSPAYLRFSSESQNWVTYANATTVSDRKIAHTVYTQFDHYIGTRFIYTVAKAENDCVLGLQNNQVDIVRANLGVSPLIGDSHLNSFGVGSDGIAVESADVFERPDGWDDDTDGDAAEQIPQPRSGIAFKGPYSLGSSNQNYYASIEGIRGSRTNGYKSGACRISVNSTGNTDPDMNTAAYFGWDETVIKSGNDSVICNTKWTSQSIVNQCTSLTTIPISELSTGYIENKFFDGTRATALGWYSKTYTGGTVGGGGPGSTFLWADNGNKLVLAADGVRINSQATGALTQYQWEFTTQGHLVSQGGHLEVNKITTQAAGVGDASIDLDANFKVSTGGEERLRITDTDIKAAAGYEPQSQTSLVTKGWVLDNSSDNSGDEPYDDTQIKADLASETDARVDADDALQANISVEASRRAEADTALTAVDVDLQDQIDNLDLSYDDTQIKTDLASEASTRAAADTALTAVDVSLQDQIDNLDFTGGGGDVTKITAGTNVTVNPSTGLGNVTVNADVGVTSLIAGDNVTISPEDGVGNVIINATASGGADLLEELDDVVLTDLMGNQVLTYDITTGKWINKAPTAGGGGVIDGGQVPGSGSTFLWYDTDKREVTHIDGNPTFLNNQPRDMFCYDGVFSDGTFWTIDGVDIKVDPNAISGANRYSGKFVATTLRSLQGRVIAGNYGYWVGEYFSQDMKQWTQTSGQKCQVYIQQKQRPMGICGFDTRDAYIEEYRGGNWKDTRLGLITDWAEIFPDCATNFYYSWTANQVSGQESAVAHEANASAKDFILYCVNINPDSIDWEASDTASGNYNKEIFKIGTTRLRTLDGCTTGFYSERLEKWFFAKDSTMFISKTSSLLGGFNQRTLPRSNAWDRCYDDGSAIVFARTGTGNSATVFTLETTDSPGNWQVSISLLNRDYQNICGTNGRGIASYNWETGVNGFVPDPADPSGEGSVPVTWSLWRYGVSGVNDPNRHAVTTHSLVLSNPIDPNAGRDLEDGTEPASLLVTQEDANDYFAVEVKSNLEIAMNAATTAVAAIGKATQNEVDIQQKTTVITLSQADYDALADVDENTLYLIT